MGLNTKSTGLTRKSTTLKKNKKPSASEAEILNAILEYLDLRSRTIGDVFCWRNNSGAVYDPIRKAFRRKPKFAINGGADIVGITSQGLLLAIEVKSPTGRLSADQQIFLEKIHKLNGIAIVARDLRSFQLQLGEALNPPHRGCDL